MLPSSGTSTIESSCFECRAVELISSVLVSLTVCYCIAPGQSRVLLDHRTIWCGLVPRLTRPPYFFLIFHFLKPDSSRSTESLRSLNRYYDKIGFHTVDSTLATKTRYDAKYDKHKLTSPNCSFLNKGCNSHE